jgi:hypothetical protein
MLCRVALVSTDGSLERSASIIRVARISELGIALAVTSNRRTLLTVFLRSVLRLLVAANVPRSPILITLIIEALGSSETSVLTRATQRTSQKTAFFMLLSDYSETSIHCFRRGS